MTEFDPLLRMITLCSDSRNLLFLEIRNFNFEGNYHSVDLS